MLDVQRQAADFRHALPILARCRGQHLGAGDRMATGALGQRLKDTAKDRDGRDVARLEPAAPFACHAQELCGKRPRRDALDRLRDCDG